MKRVKIAELKDHLSENLRAVERGAQVEVTDRDRPVALIVPIPGNERDVVPRDPAKPFSRVRRKRFEPAGWPISSTELLLQERQGR